MEDLYPAERGSTAKQSKTCHLVWTNRRLQTHLSLVRQLNVVDHESHTFVQHNVQTLNVSVKLWLQLEKEIYDDTGKFCFSLMYLMTFYNQHCSHYKVSFEFHHKGIYTKFEQYNSNLESCRIYYSSAVALLSKGIMQTLKKICI